MNIRLWNWIHKLGSAKHFYRFSSLILPGLWVASVLILSLGLYAGLMLAPADYQQGDSFRIMYIHVPAAILSQSSYVMMASMGGLFLIWKIKLADVAMRTVAPIGAAITFVALLTGAIWGKPTWGTWWVWDARLTSTLILMFLFLGVLAIRNAAGNGPAAGRMAAILAVIGVINLPIIKYSVDWWFTLHQPASFSLTERPAMPVEMWLPLVVMIIGFYSWFFALWILRIRTEVLVTEANKDWVRQLVNQR
jgi:heme exporter protein C